MVRLSYCVLCVHFLAAPHSTIENRFLAPNSTNRRLRLAADLTELDMHCWPLVLEKTNLGQTPLRLFHKLRAHTFLQHPGCVALCEKFRHRLPAAGAEVECPVIDIHADEAIGLLRI